MTISREDLDAAARDGLAVCLDCDAVQPNVALPDEDWCLACRGDAVYSARLIQRLVDFVEPEGEEMIELENWSVGSSSTNPYLAPELREPRLRGTAENHPEFPESHSVITSPIRGQRNDCVVTKSGSEYKLGAVDPGYEVLCPNAEARLFATLPQL